MITAEHLAKRFRQVLAVDDLSFELERGTSLEQLVPRIAPRPLLLTYAGRSRAGEEPVAPGKG